VPLRTPATAGPDETASTPRRAARPHPAKAVRQRNHRLHLQRGGIGAEVGRPGTAQPEERRVVPRGTCPEAPPSKPGDSRAPRNGAERTADQDTRKGQVEVARVGRLALACVRGGWTRLSLWRTTRSSRRRSPARNHRRSQEPRALGESAATRTATGCTRFRVGRPANAGSVRRRASRARDDAGTSAARTELTGLSVGGPTGQPGRLRRPDPVHASRTPPRRAGWTGRRSNASCPLLNDADKAMYQAKRQGKGRLNFATDAQGEQTNRRDEP